jgi:hypothetical protein
VGEELGVDRGWDVDLGGTAEESKGFGLEEMEKGARVADDPYQRSASLSSKAQRMSSR